MALFGRSYLYVASVYFILSMNVTSLHAGEGHEKLSWSAKVCARLWSPSKSSKIALQKKKTGEQRSTPSREQTTTSSTHSKRRSVSLDLTSSDWEVPRVIPIEMPRPVKPSSSRSTSPVPIPYPEWFDKDDIKERAKATAKLNKKLRKASDKLYNKRNPDFQIKF